MSSACSGLPLTLPRWWTGKAWANEPIGQLPGIRRLLVIARNSSFSYKDQAVDVRQVGRELGVRYVLEGSVGKAGNRVGTAGEIELYPGVRHGFALPQR